ncbi:MAG: hypothetical protein DRP41_03665 [Thermodesulfobacteriota bacterium]|nr:MAG: hypothetical protein DRP41_03665 [Thermodesulfobacteriota bacterium]
MQVRLFHIPIIQIINWPQGQMQKEVRSLLIITVMVKPIQIYCQTGGTYLFSYNSTLRVTTVTDPEGNVTTNTYDPNGNLLTPVDPEGVTIEYEYYANGLLKNIKKSGIKKAEFTYFPDGNITRMTYDEFGRLTSKTDANGYTTSYIIR